MGIGILLLIPVILIFIALTDVHASISDVPEIRLQNIIIQEKQNDLNYYNQQYDLLYNNSNESWDSIREFNTLEIEIEYATSQLTEARVTLRELITERSNIIKAERLEQERIAAKNVIIDIEPVPTLTGLTNLIGIDLSKTCEISDCLNYSDLIHLDSSNQKVSGEFIFSVNNNDTRRDKPELKESWRWYDYDNQLRIIVDPPVGMAERIKMITITSNFNNYILKNDMLSGTQFNFINNFSSLPHTSQPCILVLANNSIRGKSPQSFIILSLTSLGFLECSDIVDLITC